MSEQPKIVFSDSYLAMGCKCVRVVPPRYWEGMTEEDRAAVDELLAEWTERDSEMRYWRLTITTSFLPAVSQKVIQSPRFHVDDFEAADKAFRELMGTVAGVISQLAASPDLTPPMIA